jgi:hypothetical protein
VLFLKLKQSILLEIVSLKLVYELRIYFIILLIKEKLSHLNNPPFFFAFNCVTIKENLFFSDSVNSNIFVSMVKYPSVS